MSSSQIDLPITSRTYPSSFWMWVSPSVLALFLALHFGVCTQDDAFISFRYAENWADGLGWVFNAGEHVEGFSNPLWTALFGLVFWMNGDPVHWSLFFGYASIVLLIYTTHHLACTLKIPTQWMWIGMTMIALDPSMVLEAVQGLESVFYAGLLPLTISYAIREREHEQHTKSLLFSGLLCLTRPEAPLFVGLLYTGLWFRDRNWKKSIQPLIAIGVLLGLMTGLRIWYFGDPLPNTFYAKVGGWAGMRGVQYCWWHCQHHPLMWLGFFGSLIWVRTQNGRLLHWIVIPYLLYVISIGGDFKPTSRFLLPLGGLFTVLTVQSLSGFKSHKRILLVATLIILSLGRITLLPKTNVWAQIRRDNLVARKVVGDWLAQYTPPNTTLAMHSIGVVPFYARRHTIDMWGLTDRTIAKTPSSEFGNGMAGHEKTNPSYVFSKDPDIYLPEDGFFQGSTKVQQKEPGFPKDFEDKYNPISIPIEGSWLNIWVHKDFKNKGGFGEWKKISVPVDN